VESKIILKIDPGVTEFEYYFAGTRKGVHLHSVMSPGKMNFKQWCSQDFFQDQDQDFKIPSRPRPDLVFKTKTKTLHPKTKTKSLLWCMLEADRKVFFIFHR